LIDKQHLLSNYPIELSQLQDESLSMKFTPFKGLKFLIRAIRLRSRLTPIDRMAPFQGTLAAKGFAEYSISKSCVDQLYKLFKEKGSSEVLKGNISLSDIHYDICDEIFSMISSDVFDYLGPGVYLDGMSWLYTDKSKSKTIGASNWHTDNVGNRLRLFVCVDGDGTQPTLIVPSDEPIPSNKKWMLDTIQETIRWCGIPNKRNIKEQFSMKHKTGSAYLWDSQLLHRGGYETGQSTRLILSMEFSNPKKHKLAKGPIGTKQHLEFDFTKKLFECQSFNSLLDPERITRSKNRYQYKQVR